MKRIFLEYRSHFDAAHYLRGYDGDCSTLHGHRWEVDLCISGTQLNAVGILFDFKDLKRILKNVLPDHKCLNTIPPFIEMNPTAETLARFLFPRIELQLPNHLRLEWVKIWESPGACARVERGQDG